MPCAVSSRIELRDPWLQAAVLDRGFPPARRVRRSSSSSSQVHPSWSLNALSGGGARLGRARSGSSGHGAASLPGPGRSAGPRQAVRASVEPQALRTSGVHGRAAPRLRFAARVPSVPRGGPVPRACRRCRRLRRSWCPRMHPAVVIETVDEQRASACARRPPTCGCRCPVVAHRWAAVGRRAEPILGTSDPWAPCATWTTLTAEALFLLKFDFHAQPAVMRALRSGYGLHAHAPTLVLLARRRRCPGPRAPRRTPRLALPDIEELPGVVGTVPRGTRRSARRGHADGRRMGVVREMIGLTLTMRGRPLPSPAQGRAPVGGGRPAHPPCSRSHRRRRAARILHRPGLQSRHRRVQRAEGVAPGRGGFSAEAPRRT